MNFLRYEMSAGDPYYAGKTRIIPLIKTLKVTFPGLTGGLIWNRPVAIAVEVPGGSEEVLPIRDITRELLWSILGIVIAAGILFRLATRQR